jgi:hypothetical protein
MDGPVTLAVVALVVVLCLALGLWLGRGRSPIDMRDPATGQPLDPAALEGDEPRGLPASAYPQERVYMQTTHRPFGPPAQHDYIGSIAESPEDDSDEKSGKRT